ncbi:uncharacterized protein M6B38_142565 [Iris pallida]|uniref:Uncharacterized protein n=1 Tax=Iris pallida TaxID=29817 RepID=A0AAX6FCC0_IRIPA|nr:uncharacterized protein M6B38_142565 [Iris pallida]
MRGERTAIRQFIHSSAAMAGGAATAGEAAMAGEAATAGEGSPAAVLVSSLKNFCGSLKKIEILKRLQREAFCDLMKLRDRQDKIERAISLYRSAKGGPFQEASTHMKGIVDVVGAALFVEKDYERVLDALEKAGTKTGVNLRFMFETAVRKKDLFVAEFVAGKNSMAGNSNLSGSPLALEKLMYVANINDYLSVVTTLGARCGEYGNGPQRGRVPSLVPPLFNQYHKCGAGVTVKGSDVAVSLAELVSEPGGESNAAGTSLSTFGQVTYQPSEEFSLTLSCLWRIPSTLSYPFKLGKLVIPVGRVKRQTTSDVLVQASSGTKGKVVDGFSSRSIALMLESEIGECNKLGGWVEIQKSRSNLLQWGVSYSDTPEDEMGWGMRIAGKTESNSSQLQLEGFLNFNMGKNVTLQPGILYAMDGRSQTPALVFRSSWSL